LRRNLSQHADSLDLVSARESQAGTHTLLGPQAELAGSLIGAKGPDDRTSGTATGTGTLSQWVASGGTAALSLTGTSTRLSPDNPVTLLSGDQDTANLMLSFKQPLLQGFGSGSSVTYQVKQADAAAKTKFYSLRGQGLVLLQQARNAFWDLAGAEATMSAQIEDSGRTERLMRIARVQFVAGSSSALDTLTAATNLAKAKVALSQGRNTVREGLRNLSILADTDQVVVPKPDTLPSLDLGADLPKVDALLEQARIHAPDLAQAQVRIEALQSEVDYRKSTRLPRLDGTLYGKTGMPSGNLAENWQVGARLDFDWLLPNGTERAKYRSSLLDLRSARIRRDAAEKELRHQIERILDAWAAAREQLALTVDLAGLQRKRMAAAEVGYSAGSTSLIDLQSVRADWMNAVTSSWQSKAQLKSLEAELETRTGIGPARQGWIWEEQ
jgi:outer membrane protein TolC